MNSSAKLIISILIDALGCLSYVLGEFIDIVVAPLTWWWIKRAYGMKGFAYVGLFEEGFPLIFDWIPTCTITHIIWWLKERYVEK